MNLLQKTKEICKMHDIKPARSKGQNFLINEDIYDKIIKAADLKKDDIVLEVGPGLGFLTEKLAKIVKKVIAIELDDKLAGLLEKTLAIKGIKNVEVVNENVLDLVSSAGGRENTHPVLRIPLSRGDEHTPAPLSRGDYKVVANLPYNITSIFLRKFLSQENKPESMTLMVQKEVAERIVSEPGSMSLLAVSVQLQAQAKIVDFVASKDFWPEPAVNSAILRIDTKLTKKNKKNEINEKEFFRLVKIGFSSKRKMLKNNLANGCHIKPSEALVRIKSAGFSENIRAQELSIEDWKKLLPKFLE